MKQLFATIVVVTLLAACHSSKPSGNATPSRVGIVNLQGYYVNNGVNLPDETNFMAITSKERFKEVFTAAAKNIRQPAFDGQFVVAIAGKPTIDRIRYTFDSAEMVSSELNVNYRLKTDGKHNYSSIPAGLATVPRSTSIKRVNFYVNGNKVKTIPVEWND